MKAAQAANAAGKQRGKPFAKGQSGNPAGKAKGTRHRVTTAAEKLLEGEAEEITRKAIELAKAGDSTAMRLVMERVYPVRKGRPITLSLPATETAADVNAAMSAVVAQMAAGEITPDEAGAVVAVIEAKRKAIETDEIDRRLREVETKLEGKSP